MLFSLVSLYVSTKEVKRKKKNGKRKKRAKNKGTALTNKGQPQKLQPHNGQDGQQNPQQGLHVQRQPEEPAVRGVDNLCAGLARLKDPFGLAGLGVDFVPPPEADEAPAGNVLEVVEVCGEEEDGDDEDHDPDEFAASACPCPCRRQEAASGGGGVDFRTYMLAVTQRPKKYTSTLAAIR